MQDRILRRNEAQHKSGLSKSGLDREEAAGNFPKRIKIGPRAVGWSEKAVNKWVVNRIDGNAA